MTTYCIDPNSTRIAIYNINTGTMPTNNVVFSEITANLSASATSITVKTGEGALFSQGMIATLEQLNAEGKATAREVVLINGINNNTLSLTRGYENCVQDDTASPKQLGNTPLAFTSGARISVYVSRALLNGVQTRLSQVNCPCNTQVYNDTMATTGCVLNNCDDWRDKLLTTKACRCYNDKGFGSGCDGDCVITEDTFLCASKEYEFNNLTINEGVLVRFEGAGTPTIRVKRKFCNMGTIDLRGGTFVGACSKTDVYTNTVVANNSDSTAYNAMCFGCGGSASGCAGGNATGGHGGDGGDATNGCHYIAPTCHDGLNGGNGAYGESCARNNRQCQSGGGGGGYLTGNGGDGGHGASGSTSDNYSMDGGRGGNGGNGGIWGRGGNGGHNGSGYASGEAGDGGNGYIGGDGGSASGGRDCMSHGHSGTGGNGIIQGGNGGESNKAMGTRGGQGGNAINNMYAFRLYACDIWNNIICAKGGNGGNGGCNNMSRCYTSGGGNGGCGANGGEVFIGYFRGITEGTVDVSGGNGGCGGSASGSENYGCPGANGTAGVKTICKIM